MPQIIPIFVPPDNYIWLLHDGNSALAVDVGAVTPLTDYLSAMHLALIGILSTHHHADHVDANNAIVAQYGVPVYGPAAEAIPACSNPLAGGETFNIEALKLRITALATPGHTLGHLAYFVEQCDSLEAPILFSGDTLFAGGCGRMFEGTPEQLMRSVRRLAALPSNTRLCCGHEYTAANLRFAAAVEPGNAAIRARQGRVQILTNCELPTLPSELYEESETNPFVRVHRLSVRQAVEQHIGYPCASDVEVFAALRAWKDTF